jgi:hypothetical protein
MTAKGFSQIRSSLRNAVSFSLAFPVVVIVLVAVGIAIAAMRENVRFAHATDQVIGLVASVRDFSAHEKTFAIQSGEDVLATLARNGLIAAPINVGPPVTLANPWRGAVRAFVAEPYLIRLETNLPAHECQRLAIFFARSSGAVGLQVMEAHEGVDGGWRRFYDAVHGTNLTEKQVEAACGHGPQSTLAMGFRLK